MAGRVRRTSLERRVDPTSTEAFENAITVATSDHPSAAESLRTAWSNVYGRTPQYSAGYAEAIKAVVSAAAPVVTPNDLKAQLGKIAGELQTQSASYRFTIARAPIDTVVAMMRSLELGQTDRHGGVQPTTPVTQEGAEAALHLAVVLVQWFSTEPSSTADGSGRAFARGRERDSPTLSPTVRTRSQPVAARLGWKLGYSAAAGGHARPISYCRGDRTSNLRPLVPQTSPYFPPRAEFDLEWFCGELVGMTTRARVMESAGIVEKHVSALQLDRLEPRRPPLGRCEPAATASRCPSSHHAAGFLTRSLAAPKRRGRAQCRERLPRDLIPYEATSPGYIEGR